MIFSIVFQFVDIIVHFLIFSQVNWMEFSFLHEPNSFYFVSVQGLELIIFIRIIFPSRPIYHIFLGRPLYHELSHFYKLFLHFKLGHYLWKLARSYSINISRFRISAGIFPSPRKKVVGESAFQFMFPIKCPHVVWTHTDIFSIVGIYNRWIAKLTLHF